MDETDKKVKELCESVENAFFDNMCIATSFVREYRFACQDDDFYSNKAKRTFTFDDMSLSQIAFFNKWDNEEKRKYQRQVEMLEQDKIRLVRENRLLHNKISDCLKCLK
jgi:hypothetical protein